MLAAVVTEAARRFGDAPAFVAADGRPLSYRELDRASDRVAAGLTRRGVGVGDVVGLTLPSTLEYVIAYVAAVKVGAIAAGVNNRLTEGERAAALGIAQPRMVLAAPEEVTALETDSDPARLPADDDRPVAVVFTSGTTGAPKGAVFCSRQLRAVVAADWGDQWGGGARTQGSTSFAHVGFMTKLPWYLMGGGTMFLLDRWKADVALEAIGRHRITSVGGVPTQVALMLRLPDFDDVDVSSVATIVVGGGPATGGLVREAQQRFGALMSIRWSSTETGGVGTGTAFGEDDIPELYVGRPRPPVEVAVRDGEVCVRSPTMMSGYHRDPDATAAAFTDDGFVRTGDLGRLDDDGGLFLTGRAREMYVRGGYNVFPLEVEAVLGEHPAVADVAVVGRPDPVMGERGVAVVVPTAGAPAPDVASLRAFAGDRLATHKLPDDVVVVDRLPLTAMDKVDRRALARLVAG